MTANNKKPETSGLRNTLNHRAPFVGTSKSSSSTESRIDWDGPPISGSRRERIPSISRDVEIRNCDHLGGIYDATTRDETNL